MTELYLYLLENIFQFLGVLFSIVYVVFSIRQNVLCWIALIIAAIFNMYAYYLIHLPLQSMMQLFFIATGLYGWHQWNKKSKKTRLKISSWKIKQHIIWVCTGLLTTCLLSVLLSKVNHIELLKSDYPFLDSLMFMFNLIPMYLTGKKILESWVYFIVIDIISGFFYLATGEFFFCFLFFCYIGFAIKGYITWKKEIT